MTNEQQPNLSGHRVQDLQSERLGGHQIQAIRQQMLNEFQRALDDVELRKIALAHAATLAQASLSARALPAEFVEPVTLAREMHAFLSEGAAALAGK
jgi:hypothetical protein